MPQVTDASRKLRAAVVGCGGLANMVLYPSLASLEDVELATVCDTSEAARNTTADKQGIEARYADHRKMVDEVAPDAVYTSGGPHTMYGLWTWFLRERPHLHVEFLIGKPRDELLHREILDTLMEAKVLVEQWRSHYNRVRPHSALGYRAPAPEAIQPAGPGSGALRQALLAGGRLAWRVAPLQGHARDRSRMAQHMARPDR